MSAAALGHLRVLDLTHYYAGSYCTKLLAGFGAEVIKVERVASGDPVRQIGPFFRDEPHPEGSIPFLWLNTGKKSVTIDLKRETGRALILELVGQVDAVVESFAPGVMSRLGLGYETLRAANPRLVMTSISNFGQTGPYRAYEAGEITAYALSGLMYLTGDPARAPLASGPAMAQYTAGMAAYIGTLVALFQRQAGGSGQHVDVSIQEAALDNIEIAMAEYLLRGTVAKRRNDRHALVPWELYPCADGYAAIVGGPVRHWLRALDLFEEPKLRDGRYAHMADRIAHRDEVEALLRPWAERHRKKEIYHAGQARKLAFSYLSTTEEVFTSPQHAARDYFVEVEHPVVGRSRYCAAPFRLGDVPGRIGRAPMLGEHSDEIFGQRLGRSPETIRRLREDGVI